MGLDHRKDRVTLLSLSLVNMPLSPMFFLRLGKTEFFKNLCKQNLAIITRLRLGKNDENEMIGHWDIDLGSDCVEGEELRRWLIRCGDGKGAGVQAGQVCAGPEQLPIQSGRAIGDLRTLGEGGEDGEGGTRRAKAAS